MVLTLIPSYLPLQQKTSTRGGRLVDPGEVLHFSSKERAGPGFSSMGERSQVTSCREEVMFVLEDRLDVQNSVPARVVS